MLKTVFTPCIVKVYCNVFLHVTTEVCCDNVCTMYFFYCRVWYAVLKARFTLTNNMKRLSVTTNHTVQENKNGRQRKFSQSSNLQQGRILPDTHTHTHAKGIFVFKFLTALFQSMCSLMLVMSCGKPCK